MGLRRSRRELPLPEELLAPERDLAGQLDDQRSLKATLEALATLAEGERSALLLRADHELSYGEVAAALEISVTAAKVRVHRARKHLARALAEQGRDSCDTK